MKAFKGFLIDWQKKVLLYPIQNKLKIARDQLNVAEDDSSPNLWHKRLGHMSEKGLQLLAKQSFIPPCQSNSLYPYDYCLFGKQHRVSYRSHSK